MQTLSSKIRDILFGKIYHLEGGLSYRKELSYPSSFKSDARKSIYWEGNLGLIITMWEKIEKLEDEIERLKSDIALSI